MMMLSRGTVIHLFILLPIHLLILLPPALLQVSGKAAYPKYVDDLMSVDRECA
jgi:hypothetical protein